MYLEWDKYLPQAFLPQKGHRFLWYTNYSISEFASDRAGEEKFIASRNHILGLYFVLETFASFDNLGLLFIQLCFPVL